MCTSIRKLELFFFFGIKIFLPKIKYGVFFYEKENSAAKG